MPAVLESPSQARPGLLRLVLLVKEFSLSDLFRGSRGIMMPPGCTRARVLMDHTTVAPTSSLVGGRGVLGVYHG